MARNGNVAPEVADQLAEAVRQVRRLVFGGEGIPVWGTKFAQIESDGMAVGLEFARLFMEQSVGEQAGHVPDLAYDTGAGVAKPVGEVSQTLTTCAGDVEWNQPESCLKESRRSFFPSGEGPGN